MKPVAKKIYGANDRLLCVVCTANDAISEDAPYCILCNGRSEGLVYAEQKIHDVQKQASDLAMGFSQRGMNEISLDIQAAFAALDSAKKKLVAHDLLQLDKRKRGMV